MKSMVSFITIVGLFPLQLTHNNGEYHHEFKHSRKVK